MKYRTAAIRHLPLAAALAFTIACGDDAPSTADTRQSDVFVPDTSADTLAPDTTADTLTPDAIADTQTPDTQVADTQVADTSRPDTTPADTQVADTQVPPDTADTADTADTVAPDTAGPTCITLAAGHTRHLVVAKPYAGGERSNRWDVFPLKPDGTLGPATGTMELGRGYFGEVAFREDGALGVTTHDDGTIGLFALDEAGQPTVLEAAFDPGPYVSEVHFDGDRLLLVDGNWPNNGGGIYAAALGCDGSLGKVSLLYGTKLAEGLVQRGEQHLIAAKEAIGPERGAVHLLAPGANGYRRAAYADPFGDDDAILSAFTVTHDGRFALVGDNSAFSSVDNRVGVVEINGDRLTTRQVITPLLDPMAIVPSPYDDAVLVVSGFGDAVHVLDYDATRDPPFVDMGEPDYVVSPPQLPGSAVLVGGAFPDLVFVAEVEGIRRFRFEGGGVVTDLGRTAAGTTDEDMAGAIGMQP